MLLIKAMNKYSPEDILLAREKRAELIENLHNTTPSPIVVLRVNYPGNNKDNEVARGIYEEMKAELIKRLRGASTHELGGAEGPILIMNCKAEAHLIKLSCIELEENHYLGRCVDIDVYDKGQCLSRSLMGMEPRRCFICDNYAHLCVRSRAHSLKQVESYLALRLQEYRRGEGHDNKSRPL